MVRGLAGGLLPGVRRRGGHLAGSGREPAGGGPRVHRADLSHRRPAADLLAEHLSRQAGGEGRGDPRGLPRGSVAKPAPAKTARAPPSGRRC